MTGEIESQVLAEQIINKAIQEIVFKYNAYAPIISSFRIAYSNMIPTMGVDKYARLMVNPDFVVKNQAYIKGVVIHEALHIFFGHTTDTRSKLAYTDNAHHNKIANIAEDCAINQFIQESLPKGAIMPYTLKQIVGCVDVRYDESAEYYYDIIVNNIKEAEQKNMQNDMCATDEMASGNIQWVLSTYLRKK